jgi:cytoskeletal protein RodZ
MRIQKKKDKKTRLIGLVAAALAVLIIVGGVYWWSALRTTDSVSDGINYNPPTPAEKEETTERKKEIIENEQPPASPPESSTLTVTISRAGQNAAGQPVSVRTIIDGASSGNCTMTLTKQGAQPVSKEDTITYDGMLTTCNADIPAASFGANGEWSLSVVAKANNATSKPATSKINVVR